MPTKKASPFAPSVVKGVVTFYLEITGTTADGVQYKPYMTHFVPASKLYVKVTVDEAEVVTWLPDGTLILTPKGWYTVAKQLATASTLAASVRN